MASVPLDSAIRQLMANTHQSSNSSADNAKKSVVIDGKRFVQTNVHRIQYRFSEAAADNHRLGESSLVDRGANGGLAGEDIRVIEHTLRKADISGINDHTVVGLPIVTAAGVVHTSAGPVCLILHQYALIGKGKSIHSSVQMECHDILVDERSRKLRKGGQQCLTTVEGYKIPLHIRRGLPYMDMHPPSDHELGTLPHVVLTSDTDWNPTKVDNEIETNDVWFDAIESQPPGTQDYGDTKFNQLGYYNRTVKSLQQSTVISSNTLDDCIDHANIHAAFSDHAKYDVNERAYTATPVDYHRLRPFFGCISVDTIKRTFEHTTRYARYSGSYPLRKHFKSRFPALNIHRRNEPVATDTIFADTPAVDNSPTCAQIFVGTKSLVVDAYGIKTDGEFVNTLEDNIRKRGAMDKLVSDRAQAEISNKVLDIVRNYFIDTWQSKPHHEHQNPCEDVTQQSNSTPMLF